MFPTDLASIYQRLGSIDPLTYAHTRNYLDGGVTRLSPYISRGVLSTKQVSENLFKRGFDPHQVLPMLQELAWRDYFQLVWIHTGKQLDTDLKNVQTPVENNEIPEAIVHGCTGIRVIDEAIQSLYHQGYMHNHVRMYVATLASNFGRSHWRIPAKWMYHHLLDGDWASNTCSWQWVAGAFSSKKYIANQENINKYSKQEQRGTFLDLPYENLLDGGVPPVLQKTMLPSFQTKLPATKALRIDPQIPTFVYNYYNIDPNWHKSEAGNRILLLEPSHFESYPISDKPVQFLLDLATNIEGIQVFVGEFDQLEKLVNPSALYYKEHPTANHYMGICEGRDWMFPEVTGYFPSFFAFWKVCKKYLPQ